MTRRSVQPKPPAPSKLDVYVEGLLTGGELPMFSRQLLQLLSLPLDKPTAARRLFELVGEDYALTWKVLRLANSYHYNRAGRSIESLTHAIVILGVETVRNLASSLMCFQGSDGRSEALRQLMIRSMVSAHVAALIAGRGGFADRETAYLAGMLQNLGEVLVAHRTPLLHAAVQRQMDEGSARDGACLKELGFTFDKLATVVGRHWHMSPSVCALWDPDAARGGVVRLARFANELARAMMCTTAAARRDSTISLLVIRYGTELGMTRNDIVDVWDRAVAEVRQTFETLGVPAASLNLRTAAHLH